ncbi:MAG: sigma-70 family RNA polymerase sigma factor [Planctomycetota bacterium]
MTQPAIDEHFRRFCEARSPDDLARVFDAAAPRLLAIALHLTGRPADAEDLVQATFLTAIQKASAFRTDAPVLPWLTGILTRHAAQEARRTRRRPPAETPPSPADPAAGAEHAELVARLRREVAQLPPTYRQVLLLKLEHGLEPAEIGEVLDVPAGTVRMRLHRGIARLRGLLPVGAAMALLGLGLRAAPRGLPTVRAAVLARLPALAPASAPLLIGGALLKKITLAVGLLALVAAWRFLPSPPADAPPSRHNPAANATLDATLAATPTPPTRTHLDHARAPSSRSGDFAPGALHVTVTNSAGSTARYVAVSVAPRDGTEPGLSTRVAAIDVDGAARFDALAPGTYAVWTDRDRVEHIARVTAGAATALALQLPDGARASGTVVDAQGVVVPHADLWLLRQVPGFPCARVGTTDAGGAFEVDGLQIGSRLGASAPGHAPSLLHPVVEGGAPLRIALRGAVAHLAGTVVDAATGAPVSDAVIQLSGGLDAHFAAGLMGWPPRRGRTNDAGRFVLSDLHPGVEHLTVRKAGFTPTSVRLELAAGRTLGATVEVIPGATLTGSIHDSAGAPVAATIRATGFADHHSAHTRCAADGTFALQCLPATRIAVTLRADGFARTQRVFYASPGEELRWDVTLQAESFAHLCIVDEQDRPRAGWQARWEGRTRHAVTDADGRVRLPLGSDQDATLVLRAPNAPADLRCDWLGLLSWSAEETTVRVPQQRLPSAELRGRVRVAPAAGAFVRLNQLDAFGDERAAGTSRVATDGAFALDRLAAGRYRLALFAERPTFHFLADLGEHVLAHGERRDLGPLKLPAKGEVDLTLRRIDGVPLRDATVHFSDADGRELPGPATPDADGRVQRALAAGDHTIAVLSDNATWVRFEVRVVAGQVTTREYVLQPAARRLIRFPAREPRDWDRVRHVAFTLRDTTGRELYRDHYDPRTEHPYRYAPALERGAYVLDLELDDGRRLRGEFRVESLEDSREPIVVAVTPVR